MERPREASVRLLSDEIRTSMRVLESSSSDLLSRRTTDTDGDEEAALRNFDDSSSTPISSAQVDMQVKLAAGMSVAFPSTLRGNDSVSVPYSVKIGSAQDGEMPAPLSLRQFEFGKLNYTEKLGKGGFGDVYQTTWLGTPVAVKRCYLAPDLAAEAMSDFKSEAALMQNLSHPHIVQMIAVCLEPLCIMMELMTNNSLEAEIEKKSIDWRTRVTYLQHGARGMAFLHGSNVIHSDLKPANMLIDEYHRLKIGDFGLSKVTRAGVGRAKAKGYTQAYASPELLRGQLEFASDVFAFGIIMWELHELKRPWGAEPPAMCILSGKRPQVPSTMYKPYRELMQACWAEKPIARPTFLQVLDQLDAIRASEFYKKKKPYRAEYAKFSGPTQSKSTVIHDYFYKICGRQSGSEAKHWVIDNISPEYRGSVKSQSIDTKYITFEDWPKRLDKAKALGMRQKDLKIVNETESTVLYTYIVNSPPHRHIDLPATCLATFDAQGRLLSTEVDIDTDKVVVNKKTPTVTN